MRQNVPIGRRFGRGCRAGVGIAVLVVGLTPRAAVGSQPAGDDAAVELDHVFVLVSADAPEARILEEAGLRLHPAVNRHTGQGTASRFFPFQNAYLELAWIDDAKIAREVSQGSLGTDIVARSDWKRSGASPFGVGLHFKPGRSLAPFPTRDYSAEWMPAGSVIKVATSVAQMSEPVIFIVPPSIARAARRERGRDVDGADWYEMRTWGGGTLRPTSRPYRVIEAWFEKLEQPALLQARTR